MDSAAMRVAVGRLVEMSMVVERAALAGRLTHKINPHAWIFRQVAALTSGHFPGIVSL